MSYDTLIANDELRKLWRNELIQNAVLKTVLDGMDESSPVYDPLPPTATDTFAIHKGGLGEGYTMYGKRLRELGIFQPAIKSVESDYGAGPKPKKKE